MGPVSYVLHHNVRHHVAYICDGILALCPQQLYRMGGRNSSLHHDLGCSRGRRSYYKGRSARQYGHTSGRICALAQAARRALSYHSLELIERAGNSTATSVVWLPKSVIYASFLAGIISVNLSLLGQVPRKVYNIIHGIESDELLLEAQAMAKEFDRELEAEAAKDSDNNADNAGKDGGKKE